MKDVSKLFMLGQVQGYRTIRESLSNTAAKLVNKGPSSARGHDVDPSTSASAHGHEPEDAAESTDSIWALRDVSFDVQHGEVVGIIGRNGAGKSTLLKILSRITEPTTGEIELFGRVSSLLEVGTGFHPELTGRENVYLNGSILGMRKREIDRKFDEIVDFSGVERFLDTPVKRYSSGMSVRLAFAVAAHLEPEILIVDEVLAVGDAEFQKKCLGKMDDVARSGRTVLFVSHNMATVESLCNRAILLESGKLINKGNTPAIISEYLQTGDRSPGVAELAVTRTSSYGNVSIIALTAYKPHQKKKSGSFVAGEDIGLKVTLNIPKNKPLKISAAFFVSNISGVLIYKCFSDHQKVDSFLISGQVYIACHILNARLVPGLYRVGLKILVNGEEIFSGDDLMELLIEAADLYGTGKLPAPPTGVFLPETKWSSGSNADKHKARFE